MADIVIPLGKDAAIYYGIAGTQPDTKEDVFDSIRDCNMILNKSEASANRRAFPNWEDSRSARKTLRLTWDLVNVIVDETTGTEDDAVDLLRSTFMSDVYGGQVGIALYARSVNQDRPVAAAVNVQGGPWADFLITRFERTENSDEIQVYSVEAAVTLIHGINPSWVNTVPS